MRSVSVDSLMAMSEGDFTQLVGGRRFICTYQGETRKLDVGKAAMANKMPSGPWNVYEAYNEKLGRTVKRTGAVTVEPCYYVKGDVGPRRSRTMTIHPAVMSDVQISIDKVVYADSVLV